MDFERPTEQLQHPNLLDNWFFPILEVWGIFKTLKRIVPSVFNEAASIAASDATSKFNKTTEMLWAISDHGKIMLEVLLEAQVAKIEQKFVFPIWNK